MAKNTTPKAGINWRRGAVRLWMIGSFLWCALALSIPLANSNVTWLPAHPSATVHVKISDTETWDYPAEWGVQRIRDDIQKIKRASRKDSRGGPSRNFA
jgi:hypothetical protein